MWMLVSAALATAPDPALIASCDQALVDEDQVALTTCVETWVLTDATDPLTDWYGFHLAVMRGEYRAANLARIRALDRGLDPVMAAALRRAALPENPMLGLTRWVLGIALLLAIGWMLMLRYRVARYGTDTDRV